MINLLNRFSSFLPAFMFVILDFALILCFIQGTLLVFKPVNHVDDPNSSAISVAENVPTRTKISADIVWIILEHNDVYQLLSLYPPQTYSLTHWHNSRNLHSTFNTTATENQRVEAVRYRELLMPFSNACLAANSFNPQKSEMMRTRQPKTIKSTNRETSQGRKEVNELL